MIGWHQRSTLWRKVHSWAKMMTWWLRSKDRETEKRLQAHYPRDLTSFQEAPPPKDSSTSQQQQTADQALSIRAFVGHLRSKLWKAKRYPQLLAFLWHIFLQLKCEAAFSISFFINGFFIFLGTPVLDSNLNQQFARVAPWAACLIPVFWFTQRHSGDKIFVISCYESQVKICRV